jgi:hypothetical protein
MLLVYHVLLGSFDSADGALQTADIKPQVEKPCLNITQSSRQTIKPAVNIVKGYGRDLIRLVKTVINYFLDGR